MRPYRSVLRVVHGSFLEDFAENVPDQPPANSGKGRAAFVESLKRPWYHARNVNDSLVRSMNATYFDTFLRAVENTPLGDRHGILGDDELVFPPHPDFGYQATPRNALTFGAMGVDGVHYAILKIDGEVTDESPVIHIGPMDFSEPYVVLGDCFLAYAAAACGVSISEMDAVFESERAGDCMLVPFMKKHFQHARLYDDARLEKLARYLEMVEQKT